MKTIARLTFALAAFAIAGSCLANSIADYPLEKKVKLSQLVGIGSATGEIDVKVEQPSGYRYQKLRIETVLKGPLSVKEIWLETDGRLPEENVGCCEMNRHYLFFLQRRRDGVYVSVDGPYGVYLVS